MMQQIQAGTGKQDDGRDEERANGGHSEPNPSRPATYPQPHFVMISEKHWSPLASTPP